MSSRRRHHPGLNVLIVDDHPDSADMLALLLRLWGHKVQVRYDGCRGWQAAQEGDPDCLILDINMPGINGYALAELVRGDPTLKRAKLVALTAYSDDRHVRRASEVGFDFRLTKPVQPQALKEVLAMIDHLKRLAASTEDLTRRSTALAEETRDLIREVRDDLRQVREDVQGLKEEVQDLKEQSKEALSRVHQISE